VRADQSSARSEHVERGALNRVVRIGAYGAVPAALLALFLVGSIGRTFAWDFQIFWNAGHHLVSGQLVYPEPETLTPAVDPKPPGPEPWKSASGFVYPAPAAVAMAPFGLLPFPVAAALFTVLLIAAVPLALLALGVRDWRCYGVAFAWIPVLVGIRLGTFTPLLVLGSALLWRYRDRRVLAAASLAAIVTAKLFLWPLAIWLIVTGRSRQVALAAAGGAIASLGAWFIVGIETLPDYPTLLRRLSEANLGRSYSTSSLGEALDVPLLRGSVLAAVFAAGSCLAIALAARGRGGDARAFVVAVCAALLTTPVAWLHYFALLLVPVALLRPRLSPLWIVPVALWLTPFPESDQTPWRIFLALGITGAVGAATFLPTGSASMIAARLRRQAVPSIGQV
jgi:hypothetical protein